jgi:hypothetical protein
VKIGSYAKFLVAAGAAVVIAIQAAISDGVLTNTEIVGVVLAGLAALSVYVVPNATPTRTAAKTTTTTTKK